MWGQCCCQRPPGRQRSRRFQQQGKSDCCNPPVWSCPSSHTGGTHTPTGIRKAEQIHPISTACVSGYCWRTEPRGNFRPPNSSRYTMLSTESLITVQLKKRLRSQTNEENLDKSAEPFSEMWMEASEMLSNSK